MRPLTDDELQLIITSLSRTYDSTSKKLERLTGHLYDQALDELEQCNNLLADYKAAQIRRLHQADRIWPIGTPQ